jgi:multisubunit Na+/H+ antiporter MnhC subunit
MNTHSPSYGPPPHPNAQSTRQPGPIATVLVALAIVIGLITATGILALVLPFSR